MMYLTDFYFCSNLVVDFTVKHVYYRKGKDDFSLPHNAFVSEQFLIVCSFGVLSLEPSRTVLKKDERKRRVKG